MISLYYINSYLENTTFLINIYISFIFNLIFKFFGFNFIYNPNIPNFIYYCILKISFQRKYHSCIFKIVQFLCIILKLCLKRYNFLMNICNYYYFLLSNFLNFITFLFFLLKIFCFNFICNLKISYFYKIIKSLLHMYKTYSYI